ncbi:hypothetical protein EEB18_000305 [Sphingopyxis sp. OPL5]|uniref:hypothetical protein n=1 Tax=Sphingopyxis sp. OPL5 TaxID=2486273 RepID=UPI00164D562F|nr:hypothetical protein [Sphingopyxis sp. OPL5]QNO27486.1 hypothetical protein EEB18_000305 [Sphingopyxis sp. OPL5]
MSQIQKERQPMPRQSLLIVTFALLLAAPWPVMAAVQQSYKVLDSMKLTSWPMVNKYDDEQASDIDDYDLLVDGNLRHNEDQISVANFLAAIQKSGDDRIRISTENNVRFSDFLKVYKAAHARLGHKLGLGGNVRFARFDITENPLIAGDDIYDIAVLGSPDMFVYIDSQSVMGRPQCDVHFGTNRVDSVQLLHFTRSYREIKEEEGQPIKSLDIFVTPQAHYECFGGAIFTLNVAGYLDFDIRMVEKQK